jgi:hypothetical protein
LVAPSDLPGWQYAAQSGPKLLRGMIRARTIAAREAAISESSEGLMAQGREDGLTLGGWPIGAKMFRDLEGAEPTLAQSQAEIAQSQIGGPGLWLRAEPDEDGGQADRLAALITDSIG